MSDPSKEAAFLAYEAILSGAWDHSLDPLGDAIGERSVLTDPTHRPGLPLSGGRVWVWIRGTPGSWQPRGTGLIVSEGPPHAVSDHDL